MTWKTALEFSLALSMLGGCGLFTDNGTGPASESTSNIVSVRTSLGEFVLELDPEAAPRTVTNFLSYVDRGFYDGTDGQGATTFHRVIADFMVQGGGLLANGTRKATSDPIDHEGPNGLLNLRGTVAMARTALPNSATSQFFVNHVDNSSLDHVDETQPGYVVFGKVRSGMETVDAIAQVPTDNSDVPLTAVVIEAVARIED